MQTTVSVMQPYVFPYIGYFQLINLSDIFVVYDDVQWKKGGWINRNRILRNGESYFISLPVSKGSRTDLIRQRRFSPEFPKARSQILQQVAETYRYSQSYEDIMPLINRCLFHDQLNVCEFVVNSLKEWCAYLGIDTAFVNSSDLKVDSSLRGEERLLQINRNLGATHYVNAIGGRELYHAERFSEVNIELCFIKAREIPYSQPNVSGFVPFLSIVDVAMNNPRKKVCEMLSEFDWISA